MKYKHWTNRNNNYIEPNWWGHVHDRRKINFGTCTQKVMPKKHWSSPTDSIHFFQCWCSRKKCWLQRSTSQREGRGQVQRLQRSRISQGLWSDAGPSRPRSQDHRGSGCHDCRGDVFGFAPFGTISDTICFNIYNIWTAQGGGGSFQP